MHAGGATMSESRARVEAHKPDASFVSIQPWIEYPPKKRSRLPGYSKSLHSDRLQGRVMR